MKKLDKRKLLGTIFGIIIYSVFVLIFTYAWYEWRSENTNVVFTIEDGQSSICEPGPDVNVENIGPVLDYNDGVGTTFQVENKGDTETNFSIQLNITSISDSLLTSSFKYILLKGDYTGKNYEPTNITGNFSDFKIGTNTISDSIPIESKSNNTYKLMVYIDGSEKNDPSMMQSSMEAELFVGNCGEVGIIADGIPITLSEPGTEEEPLIIYVSPGVGYFSDANLTNQITKISELPTKTGNTFTGYPGLTDEEGNITADTNAYTEPTTVSPNWTLNNYNVKFYDNQNYLSGSDSLIVKLNSRSFYKKYDDPALVGYYYNGTHTGPLLIGTTEESVAYYTNYDESVLTSIGSFEYNDTTYYYSSNEYWMSGDLTDQSGLPNRTKYTGQSLTVEGAGSIAGTQLLDDNITSVTQDFTYDELKTLDTNVYTKTGYNFLGWGLEPSGEIVYTNQQEVKNLTDENDESVNLYAIWEPKTITIDYYENSGTGTMENSTYTYGNTVKLSANTFTKSQNTFTGWVMKYNGNFYGCTSGTTCDESNSTLGWYSSSGPALASFYKISNEADFGWLVDGGTIFLYAQWKVNTYTVSLDGQGATSVGSTSVVPAFGSAMPTITKPTREYEVTYNANSGTVSPTSAKATYTFGGYYTEANGSGTQYYTATGASARNWDLTSNTILYAKWTSASVTLPTPTRTGYTFNGWYDAASGGTKIGDGGATYTPTTNKTLYAQWTVNNYYIDLNWNLDGSNWSSTGTTAACANLVIGGVDKGCVADYYAEHPHGTTYSITYIKLNNTQISYTYSGTVNGAALSHSVPIRTLTIGSNNTSYGTTSATSLYVKNGTTYTTSGATLTLSDGRKVTATATAQTAQYSYAFSSWSSTSGTISNATTLTANFTRSTRTYTVTINVNRSGYGTVSSSSITGVAYGTTWSSNGATLTVTGKTAVTASVTNVAGYITSFSSWSAASGTVTGATTITANFSRSAANYSISSPAIGKNTLAEAVTVANAGATITLQTTTLSDSSAPAVNKNLTLSVGVGKTLTMSNRISVSAGTLTIWGGGTIKSSSNVVYLSGSGNVTLGSITLSGTGNADTIHAISGSTGTISIPNANATVTGVSSSYYAIYSAATSGKIDISNGTVSSSYWGIYVAGTFTMSGGTVATTAGSSSSYKTIYFPSGSKGTITGGVIKGNNKGQVIYLSGSLTINGTGVTVWASNTSGANAIMVDGSSAVLNLSAGKIQGSSAISPLHVKNGGTAQINYNSASGLGLARESGAYIVAYDEQAVYGGPTATIKFGHKNYSTASYAPTAVSGATSNSTYYCTTDATICSWGGGRIYTKSDSLSYGGSVYIPDGIGTATRATSTRTNCWGGNLTTTEYCVKWNYYYHLK